MALIKFSGGGGMPVPLTKAIRIWEVLQGEVDGTAKEQAIAMRVQRIYMDLNDARTPTSYKMKYAKYLNKYSRNDTPADKAKELNQNKRDRFGDEL